MSKRLAVFLLQLISMLAASESAYSDKPNEPSSTFSSDSICAHTCSLQHSQVFYKPNSTYTYKMNLLTKVGIFGDAEDLTLYSLPMRGRGMMVTAVADISVYGPCEFVLKLRNVGLYGPMPNEVEWKAKLEQEPIHFAYDGGMVVHVCASSTDDPWVVNMKKSIISTLQMTSLDVSTKQTVIESDNFGECETTYEQQENDDPTIKTIKKAKQTNKCVERHQANVAFMPLKYGLNHVLRFTLPIVKSNSTYECTQNLKDKIIDSVNCKNLVKVWPLTDHKLKIESTINVYFDAVTPTLTVQPLTQSFRKERLTLSSEMASLSKRYTRQDDHQNSVQNVQKLLREINSHVQTSFQLDVPVLFSELIQSLQSLSTQEQAHIWDEIRSGELGSSHKLLDIFLDASALAGNEGSAEVLIRALQQQQISRQRANYLFGLLSFVNQPSIETAQRLVQFVQQQSQPPQQLVQIQRGVLFGITGFVNNLQIAQQQNPNVDQVVRQISNLLVQGVQQLVQQITNQQQEHQAITLVYALRNLVLVQGQSRNQQISQQLVQILQQVQLTQFNQGVRVAIVQTLAKAGINDQIRQYLVEQLIQNPQEGIEIQIEAYRAVVLSGATTVQLEQVRQYTDRMSVQSQQLELVNYIRSHHSNLRANSDPHKQTILPVNAPVFAKPSKHFLGISRNYQLTYVKESLNLGVTAETDIIYNQQKTNQSNHFPVPQTLSFNLTIPIGGTEMQLVEVRLHQHGLEPLIAQLWTKIQLSGVKDLWNVVKHIFEYIIQHTRSTEILTENPQICLLLQISINGKTVVLIDEHDFMTGEIQSQSLIQELLLKLHTLIQMDRAFAFTPINTVVQFLSANGLPVQVRVNSSVVLGLQSEFNFDFQNSSNSVFNFTVNPSIASQLDTSVEFFSIPEQIGFIQNFNSNPRMNMLAEVTNGRGVSFKFNLPDSRYSLARCESQIWIRNIEYQRVHWVNPEIDRPVSGSGFGPNIHACTQSSQKPLGFQLCYDYSTPNANGIDLVAEMYLDKTDHTLRTYELNFESHFLIEKLFATRDGQQQPQQEQGLLELFSQIGPFKFVFNTPGSVINREIVFELELPNSSFDWHEYFASLSIQTPWKRVLCQLSTQNPVERVLVVGLTVDDENLLNVQLTLGSIISGFKLLPRMLMLIGPSFKIAQLNGIMSFVNGPMSMLHFNMEDQAKRQHINGTFTHSRTGLIASRTSAKTWISLTEFPTTVDATFELAERFFKLDCTTNYQMPSWPQKEQAKIAFEFDIKGNLKMFKFTNFGVVNSSQYPQYQVQYNQNAMYIAGEQFEHDLKLGWAVDHEEQIRLYYASKKACLQGKMNIKSQSIVVYRPQNINYEVKSTASLIGFGSNSQKRYHTIVINGQSRDHADSDSNFQAEFAYSRASKSPLKMNTRAAIRSSAIHFIYSDVIEEPSQSNYHGNVRIQFSPEHQYSSHYVY